MAQTVEYARFAEGGREVTGSHSFATGAATLTLDTKGMRRLSHFSMNPVNVGTVATAVSFWPRHTLSGGVIKATAGEIIVFRTSTIGQADSVLYRIKGW